MSDQAAPERIALVTGATAGIGLATALGLARAGFRVIAVGRNPGRVERARRTIAEAGGTERVEGAIADFSDLDAVRDLAETVRERHDRLDVLVNNAGLISPRFHLSEQGYELTVAVNHLAPFLLTNLLLHHLRASVRPDWAPRIVTVASRAHRGERIDLETLLGPRDWSPLKAYGRSKLCNILFTRALARRLEGSGVAAACLHPGVVATAIGDRAGRVAGLGWRLVKRFLITPEQGAQTSLFLATVPDPMPYNGAYLINKKIARPDPTALDDDLGEAVWRESARLVGLQ